VGQEERPEITPHHNVPQANKKPKGKEPRAVGILQLNGNKGILVPVAILIDGRFYDASAYKADPIPMALESGTVYEAEQAGDSQGFFTVNGALHSTTAVNAHPWVGSGTYLPPGAEATKSTRKAENVPVGLSDSGDEPPRLTRKESSTKNDSAANANSPSSTNAGAEKTGGGTASSQSGDGSASSGSTGQGAKPAAGTSTSDKNADQSSQQKSSSTSSGQSSPSEPGQTSPSQTSSGSAQSGQAGTAQTPTSQTSSSGGSDENYYRPTLRRGKPTTAPPPDDPETPTTRDGTRKMATVSGSANAASTGNLKVMAAISDAAGPDPQSYKFFWKTGEEEERRGQMVALAENEVRTYATALVKNQISGQPVGSKMAIGKSKPVQRVQPVLENVQFHGFDVWLNNQLVMILTADAHMPGTVADTSATPESYSVTLVARTDIYGTLQKLYSGVTDKFHLDVTPRLELIDVVDADGDGRGELLFGETSDAGNGYLIYRATADRLWKMFDSLNAE
jgi:hypothetical protein